METLIIASLITAFIAGIAALFAPCCITVLLPSYLGSIFREKRKVFLMTFVFFLGLLAVFLPLGMGAAGLGKLFSRYHDQ
ncbi:MAG: Cytochrome c biogenesis protein transmembrane region, partial [Candidatus Giovannonibacteria bacterium GW2011_GWC2_44_8]